MNDLETTGSNFDFKTFKILKYFRINTCICIINYTLINHEKLRFVLKKSLYYHKIYDLYKKFKVLDNIVNKYLYLKII